MTDRHPDKSVVPALDRPVIPPPVPVTRLISRPSVAIINGRLVVVKQLSESRPSYN